MANTNAPNGFQPDRNITGAPANFAQNQYFISTANTHSIALGDPVTLLATGFIDLSLTTDTPIQGIFLGCQYYDTVQGRPQYQPAWRAVTTAVGPVQAFVMDDKSQVLRVQASAANITQANVGMNANFTGAGNPVTGSGISQAALDSTTISTTNTLPFRIVSVTNAEVGNDSASSYNSVEVVLNAPGLNNTTGI